MAIDKVLMPGEATLGVMGGGQLGRMFVQAAQSLGYRAVVLDADADSPAGAVAHQQVRTGYLDPQGLAELAAAADAITTEFENVPAQALATLAEQRRVAPAGRCVAVCQDRADEKAHFKASGVACAPHAVIRSEAELAAVDASLLPGILKTARMGYDGKGQARVRDRAELAAAWAAMKGVPCVLEQLLPLDLELSVIVARGLDGQVVEFPVQQNLHRDGILAVTEVPAPSVPEAVQAEARTAAARIATELGYVGVLCVEFFLLKDGRLLVNEMAPRPHNSGHYTLDACDVSQFEAQVRALAGLPLRQPRLHSPVVMLNLLGDLWFDAEGRERSPCWDQVLALPGAHLHLYGKAEPRQGRKMGHLNIIGASAAEAAASARQAAALLGLPSEW
ncbi:5-(carboxyamino)imidazole ribonucleotide synthase [Pelomonas sp. SE-A7]|uniref:5-(carboxyamino)imidazole ribonucleotide synthase n=1 Tax=Pelomonas sp. SE-A7 TaxID=3054953 RepID=UPI00259C8DF1|nr:5-(carboxyamino)imidazole ribonucleotide synthase [Pelomonas sp. SE-A7]MDM4766724.1 5-(carboxyamino)imidazole ribonucleotide synthase [Pelomonas sp. SE-A7]